MLVQLHFPRRFGGYDPRLETAEGDMAMEIFLNRSGRLKYKFCPKAERAIGVLIAQRSISEKEAQRLFVDSFEELERLSIDYLKLPNKDTPKALAMIRRADELRRICGAVRDGMIGPERERGNEVERGAAERIAA